MTNVRSFQNPSPSFDFFVIGAGLAGSEAALTLAHYGKRVCVFEQKPKKFSAVHKLPGAAELVCSNSFKSLEIENAHGLMKEELRLLDSPVLNAALESRVPGGKALSVDRERLTQLVTEKLKSHPLITFVSEEITEIPQTNVPVLIATGPLTSEALSFEIQKLLGEESLYFYDATSPVVTLESLDLSKFFWGNRNQEGDDYLNLPLTREEYLSFRNDLLTAEKAESHMNEELKFFEGCLPIEVLAERGEETLACSCMKPSGLNHPMAKNAYALIQFRREKAAGDLLNLVGFQSRMKWPEQKRVFSKLPGMQEAEFVRFGAMHRNTFINAPRHLSERLNLKTAPKIFFAGQITGGEGYTEALATGHYAALQMMGLTSLPEESTLRSLVRYLVTSDATHFQPMNFNFGLLPPLPESHLKSAYDKMRKERAPNGAAPFRAKESRKRIKNRALSERTLAGVKAWISEHSLLSTKQSLSSSHPLVLTPTELAGLISTNLKVSSN